MDGASSTGSPPSSRIGTARLPAPPRRQARPVDCSSYGCVKWPSTRRACGLSRGHGRSGSCSRTYESLERDYEIRGLKSGRQLRSHLVHVRAYFGDDKALAVTTERLRDFVAYRQKEGSKPASIKRQLEAVRRAFVLAAEAGTVTYTPAIPSLTIQNARQGFLSRADFEALVANITDPDVRDFTDWGFWTGMRKGEIASLTWEALDRDGDRWTLRLHAKDAKTGHGRTLALEGPLRTVWSAGSLADASTARSSSTATASLSASLERRGRAPSGTRGSAGSGSTTCAARPCGTWSARASIRRSQ
jgi:hypothetical protein